MKLDNRPKKLLVKGANLEQLQGVRDWYEVQSLSHRPLLRIHAVVRKPLQTTGQVESVDTTDDGSILVSFRSRPAAEQVHLYSR